MPNSRHETPDLPGGIRLEPVRAGHAAGRGLAFVATGTVDLSGTVGTRYDLTLS